MTQVLGESDTAWRRGFPAAFEPGQERAYGQWLHHRMRSVRLWATLVGVALWSSFLLWDAALALKGPVYAEVVVWIMVLRLLVAAEMLAAFLVLILSEKVKTEPKFGDRLILWSAMFVYLDLTVIVGIMPSPYDQLYGFTGLALVSVCSFGLFGLSARAAAWLALWQLTAQIAIMAWCTWYKTSALPSGLSQSFPLGAFFLTGMFIAVGCMLSWLHELISRRSFLDQQSLAIQNEEIRRHGLDLQHLNDALAASSAEAQERLQAVIELQARLHQEAEARNRERALFMASAVHDMRQPVQAIMSAMFPASLAMARGDQAAVSRLIEMSQQATHVLQDQLTSMLEIAHLESGRVLPTWARIDMGQLLDEICTSYQAQAQAEGVLLSLTLPKQSCWVRSDVQFLRRIVGNLLSNAIKYRRLGAEGGSRVALLLSGAAEQVQLQVQDNGIGIAKEFLDDGAVFKPFFQIQSASTPAGQGVGMGLTVVQKLLTLLSGHALSVHSELGAGTTFALSLPLSAPEHEVLALSLPEDVNLQPLAGLYVLVVMEDVAGREAVLRASHLAGILVESCDSYEDLVAAGRGLERRPDALVCAYGLPLGRTAHDVRRLQCEVWPGTPLLVCCSTDQERSALRDLQGVSLLPKPVDAAQLLRSLLTLTQHAGGVADPAQHL